MQGKPYAGNPHVRFDDGAGAPRHSGRSALLYKAETLTTIKSGRVGIAVAAMVLCASAALSASGAFTVPFCGAARQMHAAAASKANTCFLIVL